MSQNAVSKFLAASLVQQPADRQKDKEGLVITVSRDTGCEGTALVRLLVDELNLTTPSSPHLNWRFVSKEILEESARQLKLKPGKVTRLLNAQDKNIFQEMLLGLSSENYPSDLKIKKTIKSVIQAVATEGNVVILGRGGIGVIESGERTLHIKLTAPIDWRIEQLAINQDISSQRAKKAVAESDKDRQELKAFYKGKPVSYNDYDVVYNVSTLSQEEIVKSIVSIVRKRNL